MKKTGNIIKTQIGIIIMVIFVGSALGYAFFGRTSPSTTSRNSISSNSTSLLGDSRGVSCGVAPKGTSSAGGCSMMGESQPVAQTTASQAVVQADPQSQLISMSYDESGLSPATVKLEVGKSYTISIKANTDVYGCMSTIYIPGLDENMQVIRKGTTISFNVKPTTAGTYEFDCAMGVSHGAEIIVK